MRSKFRAPPSAKPAQSVLAAKVQAQLVEAIALHQRGHLAQAREMYEAILKGNPRHFDALHLLGVIAARQSRSTPMKQNHTII
jgi:hypothetical protein